MGFDLKRFTKRVDKEFYCPLCHLVLENAVESPHCQHIYCKQCIETWLKSNTVCPIDKITLNFEEVKSIPNNFRNLLFKLEIKCGFESEGCMRIVSLENLESHVQICLFNPKNMIICLNGCGLEMIRIEYRNHNCLTKLAEFVMILENENRKLAEDIVELKREQLWYTYSEGITVYDDNLIECEKRKNGFARSRYALNELYSIFELEIVELENNPLTIGLSYTPLSSYSNPQEFNSQNFVFFIDLIFRSGKLFLYFEDQASQEIRGQTWKNGDIISCGVKFQNSNDCSFVYFNHNNALIIEKKVKLREEPIYPTVFMCNQNGGLKLLLD